MLYLWRYFQKNCNLNNNIRKLENAGKKTFKCDIGAKTFTKSCDLTILIITPTCEKQEKYKMSRSYNFPLTFTIFGLGL